MKNQFTASENAGWNFLFGRPANRKNEISENSENGLLSVGHDLTDCPFFLRAGMGKRTGRVSARQERRRQDDETNESSQPHACHHPRSDGDLDKHEFWHVGGVLRLLGLLRKM